MHHSIAWLRIMSSQGPMGRKRSAFEFYPFFLVQSSSDPDRDGAWHKASRICSAIENYYGSKFPRPCLHGPWLFAYMGDPEGDLLRLACIIASYFNPEFWWVQTGWMFSLDLCVIAWFIARAWTKSETNVAVFSSKLELEQWRLLPRRNA